MNKAEWIMQVFKDVMLYESRARGIMTTTCGIPVRLAVIFVMRSSVLFVFFIIKTCCAQIRKLFCVFDGSAWP